jgi:hypothetical protein
MDVVFQSLQDGEQRVWSQSGTAAFLSGIPLM